MRGEYSKEIEASLMTFLSCYEPANSRNAKYLMSTLAVYNHIIQNYQGSDFSLQDAYNFMLKAGYASEKNESDIKNVIWLLKKR